MARWGVPSRIRKMIQLNLRLVFLDKVLEELPKVDTLRVSDKRLITMGVRAASLAATKLGSSANPLSAKALLHIQQQMDAIRQMVSSPYHIH